MIHAGELLPDGRPRFRTILVLISRQAGKTHLLYTLTLFWLFVDRVKMVLGTSTNLTYAKEPWSMACDTALSNPYLKAELGPHPVRAAAGEETLQTLYGRYRVAASNRRGGRSLTIDRLCVDELREHHTFDAWNAATNACNAVPDAQIWAVSNQGDDSSVVLDALRGPALKYIETGEGDPRLGLFEWSAPAGSDPTDPHALAMANPNLGRRTDLDSLMGAAIRAKNAGGAELAGFKTEAMCMRVDRLDPAIDPANWALAADEPINLADHRDRVALCVDVSLDGRHASLVAAVVIDGKTHVEVVRHWSGPAATQDLRRDLPGIVARVSPRVLGWFPSGPAAAVAADLADRKHRNTSWPPRGVKVEALKTELAAICMGLAEQVDSRQVVHIDDPMLNAHIACAQKNYSGSTWTYTRQNSGPIDGAYATAGAVHLARTLPPPRPPIVAL